MQALIVDFEPVWGYSIKRQIVSKAQYSLSIPPPTSLIGAITYGLGKLLSEGEIRVDNSQKIRSLAYYFFDIFPFVSAFITNFGIEWTDINRYQILQFQRPERRHEETYRFGAVPTGKIYVNGEIIAIYVINEESAIKKIGTDYEEKLLMSAYMINRIGSKESIVSVNRAEFAKLEYSENKTFCTKLYHPMRAIKNISLCKEKNESIMSYFMEYFWNENSYEWGGNVKFEEYLIPAERTPLRFKWINITANDDYKVYYIRSNIKEVEGQGFAVR
ncbi:MAG: type I-A CRISPR-associated protein Cas5a [Thermoprotei archaeon]